MGWFVILYYCLQLDTRFARLISLYMRCVFLLSCDSVWSHVFFRELIQVETDEMNGRMCSFTGPSRRLNE